MNKFFNIQTKLMAVLLIPLLSIVFITVGLFNALNNLNSNFDLVNENKQKTQTIGSLLVSLQNASSSLGFSLGSDSNELSTVRNYEAQFNNSASDLESNLEILINSGSNPEEINILLSESHKILELFISASQESFLIKKELLTQKDEFGTVDIEKNIKLTSLNDQIQKNKEILSNKVNEIVTLNNEVTAQAVSEYERTHSSLYVTILIESVLSIIVMLVVGYFASYFAVIKPVKTLTEVATSISRGQLDAKIDQEILESSDEIGGLARAFDRTMVSLKLAMKANTQKGDVV